MLGTAEVATLLQDAAAGPAGLSTVDPSFEFDAPRFYDFGSGSPEDGARAPVDAWFNTSATKGLVSPEVPLSQAAPAAAPKQQVAQQPGPSKALADRVASPPAAAAGTAPAAAARQVLSPISRNRQVAAKQNTQGAKPSTASPHLQPATQFHSGEATVTRAPGHAAAEAKPGTEAVAGAAAAPRKRAAAAAPEPPQPRAARPHAREGGGPEPREAPQQQAPGDSRRHRMRTRSMGGSQAPPRLVPRPAVPPAAALAGAKKRGRDVPAKPPPPAPKQQSAASHKLTLPKSPSFQTRQRVRPARFKPREEVEAEEMAAMPQFKARPVNKRMLQASAAPTGVPPAASKPPTAPAPFHLATNQRAAVTGGAGKGGKRQEAPPAAGSFAFQAGAQGERVTRNRARGAPPGGTTQPAPFHLATDTRGASKRAAQGGAQQQEAEEALMQRPAKRARTAAAPGPFTFRTDARARAPAGQAAAAVPIQAAQPATQAAPERHPRPAAAQQLTIPKPLLLASDKRAAARREFDAAVAQRQRQEEAEKAAAAAAAAAREEEERRQQLREVEFHALPLPPSYGR